MSRNWGLIRHTYPTMDTMDTITIMDTILGRIMHMLTDTVMYIHYNGHHEH
jgi:hypothetical protein